MLNRVSFAYRCRSDSAGRWLSAGKVWTPRERDRCRAEIERTGLEIEGLQRRLKAAQDAATLDEGRVLRERRRGSLVALAAQEQATVEALAAFERELAALGEIMASAKRLGMPPADPGRQIRDKLEALVRRMKNRGLAA